MLISSKQLPFQFRLCALLRSPGETMSSPTEGEVLLRTAMVSVSWSIRVSGLIASLGLQSPLMVVATWACLASL